MKKPIKHAAIVFLSALALLAPLEVLEQSKVLAQGRMQTSFPDGRPPSIVRPADILSPGDIGLGGGRSGGGRTGSGGSPRCRPDYTLRFCMLATRNLTLDGNIITGSESSSAGRTARRGENVVIGCYGKADIDRNGVQVYTEPDGFKWTTGSFRFGGYGNPACPPHPALPLLPVLRPSASKRVVTNPEPTTSYHDAIHPAANEIYDISLLAKKQSRGREAQFKLGGGDYISGGLIVRSLETVPKERVRLFLTDSANADGYAFITSVNASVGAERFHSGRASDFQIWYNGQGTIKLDHNTHFCGIIYAPNARVEMGTSNCMFEGAIVARDIVCGGNTHITYDEDLARIALDK
jgi:hypothetical protein